MRKTDEIYLEIFHLEDGVCRAPIETVIALFAVKYCDSEASVRLTKSESDQRRDRRGYSVDASQLNFQVSDSDTGSCQLPNVIASDGTVIAGLCASLRRIVESAISRNSEHRCRGLLGFKDSCLLSPAESSVWTKYCEVDLISTLHSVTDDDDVNAVMLPLSLARFEAHMSEPVRLHNVHKYAMSKKFAPKEQIERGTIPRHLYAEGFHDITLADIIIFVCFRILANSIPYETLSSLLPLSLEWYERVMEHEFIEECSSCIRLEAISHRRNHDNYSLPVVEKQSLYKSDRSKPRYTRQEDIDACLRLVDVDGRLLTELEEPFAAGECLDWNEIPYEARPDGGALPLSRLKRKFHQLENLCKPVLRLAKPGNVIVDFCSGSGHLGILVAHLLPRCTVVLVENKRVSLDRSKERVAKLRLTNVQFYQCNLDYFKGSFDIGVSLHACGVATDLVIQHCIRTRAIFVCCPCCYGSIRDDCHRVTYPRSQIFRDTINSKDYLVLVHAADQTHDEKNPKTRQGNECMAIIDTDRKLQAEQFGYVVHMAKLRPPTCTPKNHLLVGIPPPENR